MEKTIKKKPKTGSSKKAKNLRGSSKKLPVRISRMGGKQNTLIQNADAKLMQWLALPLPGKTTLSDFEVIALAHHGITKGTIDRLASHIGVSRKNMAEHIFDISVKTLERKDTNARLDKKTSSHALEIARVVQHAYEVFRDQEKVKLWVNRENRSLDNMKPVQLFDTLTGLNMVNDILGRIEEGVYS